jgi:DNA-binding CsgD family transcriptional regulator
VLALGLLGRITEAVAAADDAEQTARVTGNAQAVQWALWMKAWTLLESGSLDAALVAADESTELGEALDASALATIGRTVRGAVLVARGEFEAGRELVALYDVDPGWICRWSPALVQASIALGDLELARAQAASASALAAVTGLAGPLAAGLRSEALVALAEDDFERGARLARDAIASARSIGGVLDEARGRLLVGRALGLTDRSAAIRELKTVSGQAIESGASGLNDEAVRELRKLGHRVGRGGRRAGGEQGIGSLSGREREVADLVAVGSTNREIAGRLFLSEKTVERHLSHVVRKLDVRSRAEVAACIAVANHE